MYPPGPWRETEKRVPPPKPVLVYGRVGLPPTEWHRHFYGTVQGMNVIYDDLNAYVWFGVAPLGVPVRVNLSESLGPTIVDREISFTYLYVSPVEVGANHFLAPETAPDTPFASFWVTSRDEEDGLINYRGRTIIGRMRETPAPQVVEVGPFTPKQVLETLLQRWKDAGHGWLKWRNIPRIVIRTSDGVYEPTIDAIAVFQDAEPGEEPKKMLEVIEEFLRPFPDYHLHVDPWGYLEVVDVSGLPTETLQGHLWDVGDSLSLTLDDPPDSVRITAGASLYNHFIFPYQVCGFPIRTFDLADGESRDETYDCSRLLGGEVTYQVRYEYSGGVVSVTVTSLTDDNPFVAPSLFVRMFIARNTAPPAISPSDITPDEQVQTLTDEVVNVCRVRSKGYEFSTQTDIMEPAAGTIDDYYYCWGNRVCVRANRSTVVDSGRFDLGHAGCVGNYETADLPNLWKLQPNQVLGSNTITVRMQFLRWGDICGDIPGPGYWGDYTATGSVRTDLDEWQLVHDGDAGRVYMRPVYNDGNFIGFKVRLRTRDHSGAVAFGVRLNGDGVALAEREETVVAEFGETSSDPNIIKSIETFGRRVLEIDMGPWAIDADTALSIAQAVVERRHAPKREYTVRVVPPYTQLGPHMIGRRVRYEEVTGYIAGWRYVEYHSASRSRSTYTIRIREIEHVNAQELEYDYYDAAAYRLGAYHTD